MGLFSDNTIVSVASTTYNLAGPEDKRPNYLKTTIASGLLTPERSLTDTLTNAYLTGPGINLRNFGHWSENHGYSTLVGMGETGDLAVVAPIDPAVLAPLLPTPPAGKTIIIQTAEVSLADYSYWVDQYMAANHPALIGTAYTADFDGTTVTITLADTSVETFDPADFDQLKEYLYVSYVLLGSTSTDLSGFQVFIYQKGSGNTDLDAFFTTSTGGGTYLPFIPLRVDNTFVSTSYLSDVYPVAKKALKKAIKANFDDLVAKINDNVHIADIDFAYVVFGVSLNTQENTARRYIYEFFKQAMLGQDLTGTSTLDWLAAISDIFSKRATYKTWLDAQADPLDPLYHTPPPTDTIDSGDFLSYPMPPNFSVRIRSATRGVMGFDMAISWSGMIETTSSGLGKVGAKVGEYWFEAQPAEFVGDRVLFTSATEVITTFGKDQEKLLLKWQEDANTYHTLTIYGLTHDNYVYQGRAVTITAGTALTDPAESGFIIPLNTDVYHSMPLVASTQMSTASAYLIINTYEVKKIAWYASGLFQVFIVVIVIVIAVAITVYTGGAAAPGILGTAGSVGATFGATGTAAVIIGAAVNIIAAMITVQIISQVSTGLFGAQVGAIVGTIASIIAVAYMTGAMSNLGGSLFDQLSSSENLLKLTSSTLNGISDFVKADDQGLLKQAQDVMTSYNTTSQEINAKYEELNGSSMVIDPMILTGISTSPSSQLALVESPDAFFNRTLMTGSDVAGLSLDMLSNFTKITLTTDLPI